MKNIKKFGGISEEYTVLDTSKVLLQSIPFDGTSSWGKGADKGFSAFLEAAENMELYDIETDSEPYRKGIHILPEPPSFSSAEEMFTWTYETTKQLLKQNKFLTFFGGEHSISIGILKAFYESEDNFSVLQIDAHLDLRPEYDGTRYNHACAVHDANKNSHLVQVGIRSMDITEKDYLKSENVFFAHQIWRDQEWEEKAISRLNDNVYITFDLDAFDAGIMPSTGTPEPGGLNWDMVTSFLYKVFNNRNVKGFDIVELAPIDGLKAPNYLAAKLYYKMLAYYFSSKNV